MPRLITWTPPPADFVKLNVDGSSVGNLGRYGVGGIFRNTHGE